MTFTVLGVTPVAATVMVPLNVPAVVSPAVFTETLMELEFEMVPVVEFNANHEPPDVVAGVAVNVTPGVPPMLTVCAGGAVVPI